MLKLQEQTVREMSKRRLKRNDWRDQVYFVCPQRVLFPHVAQMLAFYTTLTVDSVNTRYINYLHPLWIIWSWKERLGRMLLCLWFITGRKNSNVFLWKEEILNSWTIAATAKTWQNGQSQPGNQSRAFGSSCFSHIYNKHMWLLLY